MILVQLPGTTCLMMKFSENCLARSYHPATEKIWMISAKKQILIYFLVGKLVDSISQV